MLLIVDVTFSAVIVTLSPVLAFFTCLLLLFHMVGSVRYIAIAIAMYDVLPVI